MKVSRRSFLKLTGTSTATILLGELGFDLTSVSAQVQNFKIRSAKAAPTICPYCGVGCGILVYSENGKLVNTEGDPDHPINQGSLCSKGSALYQIHANERRLQKPLYRAPGSDRWEEKEWDWMLDRIAEKVKTTRDKTFITKETITDEKTKAKIEVTVNRTDAIASLGGAALDNEECYTLQKLMRGLGVVYLEHQARI